MLFSSTNATDDHVKLLGDGAVWRRGLDSMGGSPLVLQDIPGLVLYSPLPATRWVETRLSSEVRRMR